MINNMGTSLHLKVQCPESRNIHNEIWCNPGLAGVKQTLQSLYLFSYHSAWCLCWPSDSDKARYCDATVKHNTLCSQYSLWSLTSTHSSSFKPGNSSSPWWPMELRVYISFSSLSLLLQISTCYISSWVPVWLQAVFGDHCQLAQSVCEHRATPLCSESRCCCIAIAFCRCVWCSPRLGLVAPWPDSVSGDMWQGIVCSSTAAEGWCSGFRECKGRLVSVAGGHHLIMAPLF